jgi:hypothetical protein
MPKYALFLIADARSEVDQARDEITNDNNEVKDDVKEDPLFQKVVKDFLSWSEAEIKAERLKGGDFLVASSKDANIRVKFHEPKTVPEAEPEKKDDGLETKDEGIQTKDEGPEKDDDRVEKTHEEPETKVDGAETKVDGAETKDEGTEKKDEGPEKKDVELVLPPPNSSVTRGEQTAVTANILGYYTTEFDTVDNVITWAQSCPISYGGFALEIRELQDTTSSITEAPAEVKGWVGDQIVFMRKQLLEQGKMKRDQDGTLWSKVEDDEEVKELVGEAEKREEQNE